VLFEHSRQLSRIELQSALREVGSGRGLGDSSLLLERHAEAAERTKNEPIVRC
jgi:hypothetical protein